MDNTEDVRDLRAAIVVVRSALPHAPTQTDAIRLGYFMDDLEHRYATAIGLHVRPTTEQIATAMLKDVANEIRLAEHALGQAAEALKFAGKGVAASHARQAATRALHAAQGLGG